MLHLFPYEKGTASADLISCEDKKGQIGRNSQGREEDKDGKLRRKCINILGYRKEREEREHSILSQVRENRYT